VKTLAVLGIFIVLIGVLLFDVLFGDNILLTDNPYRYQPWSHYGSDEDLSRRSNRVDSFRLFLPWKVELSRRVREGRLPLWSPDIYGGTPFLADPQAQALYPVAILLALADPLDALGYDIAIHLFIALVGMYMFLRVIGMTSSALIGAVAYGFSSCFFAGMVHPTAIAAAAWLPFYFYAFERARERAVSGTLLMTVFLVLGYLGCHPQVYLVSVAALVVYAAHAIAEDLVGRAPRKALSGASSIGIAGGLALLLVAVQLLPFLELLGNSTGLAGEGIPPARPFGTNPLLLASMMFPNLFGNPVEGTRWIEALSIGGYHYPRSLLAYCGAAGLLAAICSISFIRSSRHVRSLVLLLVLTLSLTISSHFRLAVNRLSPFPGSAGFGRLFVLVCFEIAALAALGYSAMSSPGRARPKRLAVLVTGCIAAAMLVTFIVLAAAGDALLPRMLGHLETSVKNLPGLMDSEVFLDWVRTQPERWYAYELRQVGLGLLFAGSGFIVLLLHGTGLARGRRFTAGLAAAFLVVLVIDLGLAARTYYVSQPRSSVFETDGIAKLKNVVGQAGRWRIKILGDKREVLTPNTNLIFGISSLQGNYRLIPEAVSGLVRPRRSPQAEDAAIANLMSVRFLPAVSLPPDLVSSPILRALLQERNTLSQVRITHACGDARLAFSQAGGESLSLDLRVPPARRLDFALAVTEEGAEGYDSLTVAVTCRTETGTKRVIRSLDLSGEPSGWHRVGMDIETIGDGRGTLTLVSRLHGTGEAGTVRLSWGQPEFVAGDCGIVPIERGYEIIPAEEGLPISLEVTGRTAEVPLEIFENGRQRSTWWVGFSGPGGTRRITLPVDDSGTSRIRLESDSSFSITACKSVYAGSSWVPGFEVVHDGDMFIFENIGAIRKGILIDRRFATVIDDGGHRTCRLNDIRNPARFECGECSITSYRPERVNLRASADRDCYLIFQDTCYPGWRASIDGQSTEILRTDLGLRAIELPAGQHDVVFEFRPGSLRLGLVLTFLGMGLTVLFAWKGPRQQPGRPVSAWPGRST
jgi:hypothetical protein